MVIPSFRLRSKERCLVFWPARLEVAHGGRVVIHPNVNRVLGQRAGQTVLADPCLCRFLAAEHAAGE